MSILLKSQVESLVVTTSSTSELSYSVMMDVFGKQEFETSSEGLITTATTTTIALPPSPNFYNSINAIFLVNNGVGSQTIDVIKVINGVEHPMFSTAVVLEAGETLQYNKNAGWLKLNASGEPMSSAGVSNGDKGDITVSNSGTTWTLNDAVVTPAKTTIAGTPDGTKYLKDDWTWAFLPASGTYVYIFSVVNSDLSGFESMPSLPAYTVGALGSISTAISTTPTLLGKFATDLGFPNIKVIPSGVFLVHYSTQKNAGANNYYSYAELYKRTSGGTETLIATTDISSQSALNTVQNITVTGVISSNYALDLTDRLEVKVYGVMVSSTATIDLQYDDATNARLELPASKVDATNFVPYAGATADLDLAKKALILQASNDARFAITISNAGTLVITPL